MTVDALCEVFELIRDKTGADEATAGTLTLAYYVGKPTTFAGGDMLAHGIALGVRKGLWGVAAEDNASIDYQAETVADAIRDVADSIAASKGE